MRWLGLAVVGLLAGSLSYGLARAGEPSSVWWWCKVWGVC